MSIKRKIKKDILGKEPQTEDEYRALANALMQWAENEDSLNIDDFPISLKIQPHIFKDFAKKSEYFGRVFDIAIRTIGCRRERLAREGKMDRQIVMATLPLYDSEYKTWLLNLKYKTEEEDKKKTFNVYLGCYKCGGERLSHSYTVPAGD